MYILYKTKQELNEGLSVDLLHRDMNCIINSQDRNVPSSHPWSYNCFISTLNLLVSDSIWSGQSHI